MRGEENEGGEVLSPFTRLLLMGGSIVSVLWFSTLERSSCPPLPVDKCQHPGQIQVLSAPAPWTGLSTPLFCCSLPLTSHTVTPTQTDIADLLWTRKPQSPSALQYVITPQIRPEYF